MEVEKMKSEAFKILYALLSILFQFGRIWTKISDLTYVALKWYVLILEGWKNWIWGCFTSLYASVLIPFYSNFDESGRIWIGTSWTYSCGIEMIFFNDEKLKKWNLRLLKSSMRIYAYLCASMRVLGYPKKRSGALLSLFSKKNINVKLSKKLQTRSFFLTPRTLEGRFLSQISGIHIPKQVSK